MDHMRISVTEPSSLILSQSNQFKNKMLLKIQTVCGGFNKKY